VVSAQADVPHVIHFQGMLQDDLGNPLDGIYEVTFRIYSVESGGTALWSETLGAECDDGAFSVELGTTSPLSLDFMEQYWLGLQVTGDNEMVPRYRLASVPYAMHSGTADSAVTAVKADSSAKAGFADSSSVSGVASVAGGVDWDDVFDVPAGFADAVDDTGHGAGDRHSLNAMDGDPVDAVYVDDSGEVGIGTTSPSEQLHVVGNTKITGTLIADYVSSNSPLSLQTDGTTRIYIDDSTGNVGIKTSTPSYGLDVADTVQVQSLKMPACAGAGRVLTSDADGVASWQAPSGGTDSDSTVAGWNMYSAVPGSVGVGTSDPQDKLHVAGDLRIDGKVRTNYITSQSPLRLQTSGNTQVFIDGTTGNVGVGTESPEASAALDVESSTTGFLPPRMTSTQRDAISSPAIGLVIYNTSTSCLNIYVGSEWHELCGSAECFPDCSGKECGDDGCGGSCGECDDGDLCTADTCIAGTCVYTPKDCDDGNICTDDSCNPSTGACEYTFNTVPCGEDSVCIDGVCVPEPLKD
jgi:hypothetical protein